jgi:hypothetical protein
MPHGTFYHRSFFVLWDVSVWGVLSRVHSALGHFVKDRRYCTVDLVKLPPPLLFYSATCQARPNSVGATTRLLLFLSGLEYAGNYEHALCPVHVLVCDWLKILA